MKRILKSIFISILCVIAIFSNTILAFADDNTNIGLTANPFYLDIPISTYSTSLPTKTYNLSTKGRYYFSGKANVQNLYSNYLFTGVSKVKIHAKKLQKNSKT